MAVNTRYSFKNVTASGANLIQKGPGVLHTVVINTTAASAIAIYDGVDSGGVKIANIAASPVIGSTLTYDAGFSTGLFVSLGGNSDITLSIG